MFFKPMAFYKKKIIDTISVATRPYTIGQRAEGGVIAYILQSGDSGYDANLQHGLVATVADTVNQTASWGCHGTLLVGAGPTGGIAIGKGPQNTIDIITECATAGTAARICSDLVEGGYSDWYLPSLDELTTLVTNRVAIGGFETTLGHIYWSSTEFDINRAYGKRMRADTTPLPANKTYTTNMRVRAVRSF